VGKTAVYLVYDTPIGDKLELDHVTDLNESAAKKISIQEDPTDDFNENRKKKNLVERNMVKQWFGKNKFLWCLQGFVLATIVFHLWLKFLD
jgi:hypothetical protein